MKYFFLCFVFLASGAFLFCENVPGFEVKNHVLVKYRGMDRDIVIPERIGINRIGEKAFAGTRVNSVKIPAGVDTIESRAFADCTFLKTVVLPNTLTRIAYRAFFNCGFLENINIPRSLRIVEGGAFQNCRSIMEMDMPDTLKSIGSRAFSGCFGLKRLSLSRRTKTEEYAFMGVPGGSLVYKD